MVGTGIAAGYRRSLWAGIAGAVLMLPAATGPARADLAGHGGPVRGIAVSDDGERVLTASFDYSVILWNLASQTETKRLTGHQAAVNAVAFAPAGRAVSASDDGAVGLWDLGTGALIHRFTGHEGKVAGIAVSPDGRLAASASWDRTVRLWDLDALAEVAVLHGHEANVNAVTFLPDGRLVSAGYDGTLRLWRTDRTEPVLTLTGHGLPVNAVAAGADVIASAGVDETVRLWDPDTGRETEVLYGHEGPVFALAVARTGDLVVSGGADGRVRLWRRADGNWRRMDIAHDGPVWALAFTPDGERLVSAGIDDLARVWDTATGRAIGGSAAAGSAALPERMAVADAGSASFARCRACHTLGPDDDRRAGPTLHRLFGRRAGSLEGYDYSDALENSDIVWTAETIDALFALGPHVLVPGSKMPLQRITDPQERRSLVDFLARETGPAVQEPSLGEGSPQ